MINRFDHVVRKEFARELRTGDFPLQYVKFSTVNSGMRAEDSVIFLVFAQDAAAPFASIKTVRQYAARDVITQSFRNLKRLNELTAGGAYERLFANAVCLEDDGKELVFSVETACPGDRKPLTLPRLEKAVGTYTAFQAHAAGECAATHPLERFAEDVFAMVGPVASVVLRRYWITLAHGGTKLPRIIQHGDLTPDNLLWDRECMSIVDYEYVGFSDIPGADLFMLFRRFSKTGASALFRKHFPPYARAIGGSYDPADLHSLSFLYYVVEHAKKVARRSLPFAPEEVVADFERIFPA